jgi:peptidoglycan LD-endopeptidase CwlK
LKEQAMPIYSTISRGRLNTCDERLQRLFDAVVEDFDCFILCGSRPKGEQDAAFQAGHSQVRWPNSKHNVMPSKAVDVIAYPIDWDDRERQTYFAGHVKGIAAVMNIKIRWGGDWDRDTEVRDNKFDDLVHFELVED